MLNLSRREVSTNLWNKRLYSELISNVYMSIRGIHDTKNKLPNIFCILGDVKKIDIKNIISWDKY